LEYVFRLRGDVAHTRRTHSMSHRVTFALATCLVLGLGTGCQLISGSVQSISDTGVGIANSVSGSAQGLLRSSGLGGGGVALAEEDRYRQDVRLATRAFAANGQTDEDFVRALGRVASTHGVTHWEALPGSWLAIGAGLREAGLPEPDVDGTLARLRLGGEQERALAREGWRAAL
jgi:hypothetical protein